MLPKPRQRKCAISSRPPHLRKGGGRANSARTCSKNKDSLPQDLKIIFSMSGNQPVSSGILFTVPCTMARVSSPFFSRTTPETPPVVSMEERLARNDDPIPLSQLRWELTQDFRAVEGLSTICKVEGCGKALGVNPHPTCVRHMECLKSPPRDWHLANCRYCCQLLGIDNQIHAAEIKDRRWRY